MRILSIAMLLWGAASQLAAQWYAGVEISATRYGGSSHDTTSTHAASQGRPGDATMLHLRVGRNWQRYGIAVGVARSKPGLAVTGQGLNLTDKSSGGLTELAAIASTRVGGIGPSGVVRMEVGPSLHLWSTGDGVRSRVGANGAVAYEWIFVGRVTASVRVEGMLSKSWFDPSDLPPEFERQVTWRYGVGLGLRYRL